MKTQKECLNPVTDVGCSFRTPTTTGSSRRKQSLFVVIATSALLALTACLPKDSSKPVETIKDTGPKFAGFNGAVTATTTGATKIKVTWNATTDEKVVAYNIYDASLKFQPTLLKTVSAPLSETQITGLQSQKLYAIRVRAVTEEQKEDYNMIDLPAIPYAGVLTAQVQSSSTALIPFANGSDADSIRVYCQVGASTVWDLMATVGDVLQTSTVLTGLTAGVQYKCRAALVVNGFVDNNSVTTSFTPMGKAASLEFTKQPGSSASGAPFPVQPVITIKDANGTVVSAGPDSRAIITLTISNNSPTIGTLRGTAQAQAVKGVATFTGLNIQESGIKILTAAKPDTQSQDPDLGSAALTVDSADFAITNGTVSPDNSTIGITPEVPPNSPLLANGAQQYDVKITLKDQFGNPVAGVKPTFTSNYPGDTIVQPTVATNAAGEATGTIASVYADSVTPRVLSISSPAGLTGVTTLAPFKPGPAAKLAFFVQPTNSPAGPFGLSTIRVHVQDAQGNRVLDGVSASAQIDMFIASNNVGAILTGTTSVTAAMGEAVFMDLGVSKSQTGYKLQATSAPLSAAFSNSFNITSGEPAKIFVAGPENIPSGTCSGPYSVELHDNGNNPANARVSTTIAFSGLGGMQIFSGSNCSGAFNATYSPGTSKKTFYALNPKAEASNISIAESSPTSPITPATITVKSHPNKVTLSAVMPAPAPANTPMSVVANKCSPQIVITPTGNNGQPGPLFTSRTVSITGLGSSAAKIYSDAACNVEIDPMNITLPVASGTTYTTVVYLKDPKAETMNLSVGDASGTLTTSSPNQTVTILASNIQFTGPSAVVAGRCSSTAYTITLRDAQGNAVLAPAETPLNIIGLSGSTTGYFYTAPGCGSGQTNSIVRVPATQSAVQIYFRDSAAENLSIIIRDPSGAMADSTALPIGISPSALRIVAPATPATPVSKTSVCVGPFKINTLDGSTPTPRVTNAINPIIVNLSGAGLGGIFYQDTGCVTPVSQFLFATGQNEKQFWFKGQYPAASLTFTASDQASVLTAATYNWSVTAAKAFLGTAGTMIQPDGTLYWFQKNFNPVAARMDGPDGAKDVKFDPAKQNMYLADPGRHRVLKFDYVNKKYIGWIGRHNRWGGIGVNGSNLSDPSNSECANTAANAAVPGWCVGGQSHGGNVAAGGLDYPEAVVADADYVYITNRWSHSVNRYRSTTGRFEGWIGGVGTTPTGIGTNGPGTCTSTNTNFPTPGWCKGGNAYNASSVPGNADSRLRDPRSIAVDDNYLYVGSYGAILRFNKVDGSPAGWIGRVYNVNPTGGAPNCTSTGNGSITPGWCEGGSWQIGDPRSGGVDHPTGLQIVSTATGNKLFVSHHGYNQPIGKYDLATGAWEGVFVQGLAGPWSITSDANYVYVADSNRLLMYSHTANLEGWIGKVSNPSAMSGFPGCGNLSINENTPGWCIGGSAKNGMDENAFHNLSSVDLDGQGNLITGQGANFPAIKSFKLTTGEYNGQLAQQSLSPREWSNDAVSFAGFNGYDDHSSFQPVGLHAENGSLYQVDQEAGRVKKIDTALGSVIGWVGAITSRPSGGDASCLSANPMGPSPAWCLGSYFQPRYMGQSFVNHATDGVFKVPTYVTGDKNGYIYVVDTDFHRIMRFNSVTGAPAGWIGRINASPTGNATGSTGCVGATGQTPGWCTGGSSQAGSGDGNMYYPSAITYASGNLYVVDNYNNRVLSFNATSGAFNGWIGRVTSGTPTGCSLASSGGSTPANYSIGWCKGGSPHFTQTHFTGDRGGSFRFHWNNIWSRGGIASDGTYLYIVNHGNYRIDKWTLSGQFVGAAPTRVNNFTNTWINLANPAAPSPTDAARNTLSTATNGWNCDSPVGLWTDSTSQIYGTTNELCGYGNSVVWKMARDTGTMIGWQGGISFNTNGQPTGGEAGCQGATGVTPGWCQGGGNNAGFVLGMFTNSLNGVTGDAHYVYLTDENTMRVTRIPK